MSSELFVMKLREGNIHAVMNLLPRLTDVNAKVEDETLLGHAVDKRSLPVIEALFQKGANPNIANYLGNTPLISLIIAGETEQDKEIRAYVSEIRRPHENDSNNNSSNDNSNNELNYSSNTNSVKGRARVDKKERYTNFEKILFLLLPVSDLAIVNNRGATALILAIESHSWEVVNYLIQHLASPTYIDPDGQTIFHILSISSDSGGYSETNMKEALHILQMLGQLVPTDFLNRKDNSGYTALDSAIAYENYPLAEHLLYKGAQVTSIALDMEREIQHGPLSEILEHLKENTDVMPPMNLGRDLKVLFGVELEICVKLTPECAKIESGKHMPASTFQEKSWPELFAMFSKFILKKSPLGSVMRDRYEYMYVSGGAKYGASHKLNLSTFAIEALPESVKVEYDKPFFTMDASVICGDYSRNDASVRMAPYLPDIQETFHIELVSPIMQHISELKELLQFLGMDRPDCFVANNSAGFHVNASLMNAATGKFIPLTSDFFTRTFFPKYRHWEYEVYPKVRTGDPSYAQCIGGTEAHRFPELYHQICKNKYVSIHRKNPRHLVEFRLFGSSANMSDLLRYTEMATEFLHSSYKEWHSFYRPSLEQTNHAILSAQRQLHQSLQNVQSRLRTRKTKGLTSRRNSIQTNLRTLSKARQYNAKTRRNLLNTLALHHKTTKTTK